MKTMQLNLFLLLVVFLPINSWAFETHIWQKANGKIAAEIIIYETELNTITSNGNCHAIIQYQIECRKKTGQIIYSTEKENNCRLTENFIYFTTINEEFNIPVGDYEIWVSWSQLNESMKVYQKSIQIKNHNLNFFFGDLILFSQKQKINPKSIARGKDIEVISSFNSKDSKNIRIQSTLLYQMRENPGKLTRAYITQQQKNQFLQIQSGFHQQNYTFNLEGLPSGNYLVDISIFEDNELISEKTHEFTLAWSGLDSVFAQLDSSIVQMEYISSQQYIQSLLHISDHEIKLQKFKEFWKKQNISPADHESLAMENYYKLIFEANLKYKRGWKSKEGKNLVLYSKYPS